MVDALIAFQRAAITFICSGLCCNVMAVGTNPDPVRNLMELVGITERVTTAVIWTSSSNDLQENIGAGEFLEHLSHVNASILHGMDPDRVSQRMNQLRQVRGVKAVIADVSGEPCSYVPSEITTQNEALFWPIEGAHAAGFSFSGLPYGWDVRRDSTPTARIGVLDCGVGEYAYDASVGYSRAWHRDLPNRDLGVYTLFYPIVVETGGSSGNWIARTTNSSHGTEVAGVAGAIGDNGVDCVGTAWWGNHIVPIKVWETTSQISAFLRGIDWGLSQDIKIFTYQANFAPGQDDDGLYELVNETMEENDALIFWAQTNSDTDADEEKDQPLLVWAGSTNKAGGAASNSPELAYLDARAPVGQYVNNQNDPDDSTLLLTNNSGITYGAGNSYASPFMAGMAATLWDALPAALTDAQRRDRIIDIILRSSRFMDIDGDWGEVNILNAFGRAPSAATVTTGTGSVDLTKFWREEGTAMTVGSDEGIGGTVRVILETVHPCSFGVTTLGQIDIRARLSGPSGNATVKLKRNNGTWDTMGTMPVSGTPTTSEIVYNVVAGPVTVQDYVNGSGNITVRIEVPGQINVQYDAVFDQVLVRTLRLSESQ